MPRHCKVCNTFLVIRGTSYCINCGCSKCKQNPSAEHLYRLCVECAVQEISHNTTQSVGSRRANINFDDNMNTDEQEEQVSDRADHGSNGRVHPWDDDSKSKNIADNEDDTMTWSSHLEQVRCLNGMDVDPVDGAWIELGMPAVTREASTPPPRARRIITAEAAGIMGMFGTGGMKATEPASVNEAQDDDQKDADRQKKSFKRRRQSGGFREDEE